MNEKLVPNEFRKIAENTNQKGDQLAAVYHKQDGNKFYIQAENDASTGILVLGPLSAHVFENLMQIMVDCKDMDRRYMPLE